MYTSMYGSVVIYIQYIYICVCTGYIYVCVYILIYVYLYTYASIYIYIYAHECIYNTIHIYMCICRYCLYIYIYIPCLYACMYACIYRFLYIFSRPSFFLSFLELLFSRRSILEFKTSPESRTGVAIQFHEPGVWQWIPRSTEGPAESLDSLSSGAQAVAFWPKIEVWEIPTVVGLLRIHSGDLLIDPDLYN